jgi:hypothetical protein
MKIGPVFEILNLAGISASVGNLGSFYGIMTLKTRLLLFYHTKGTSLRRTTYFEPPNVKIGSFRRLGSTGAQE